MCDFLLQFFMHFCDVLFAAVETALYAVVDGALSVWLNLNGKSEMMHETSDIHLTGDCLSVQKLPSSNAKFLTSSMRHPNYNLLSDRSKSGLIARCFSVKKSVFAPKKSPLLHMVAVGFE